MTLTIKKKRDMATEEQLERKWKNVDKSPEKGTNDDTIKLQL